MILVWLTLAGLGASLTGLFLTALQPYLRRMKQGWFIIACAVAAIFANSSGGVSYSFQSETGIFDNGSYFDAEKNTLEARWTFAPWVEDSTLKWFYTFKTGDDNIYHLPDAKISECHASFRLPDEALSQGSAIVVTCYADYVAPPVVVTNGVYHLSGVTRDILGGNKFITPKVEIVVNLEDGTSEILTPTNQLPKVKGISE